MRDIRDIQERINELEMEMYRICCERRRKGANLERLNQRKDEIKAERKKLKRILNRRRVWKEQWPSVLMFSGWGVIITGALVAVIQATPVPGLGISIAGLWISLIGIIFEVVRPL